ncbi:Cation channel sperm-associated protein 4 [Boothiomyces sp. JEL0866]|nr:Cation channel sperm-associated protein 4 [Boothiomyces sp. JEL0866]
MQLNVEQELKHLALPRISKETLQKAAVANIPQEADDLSEAYEKLENYRHKAKLERAAREDSTYTVDNTNSYQKVQQHIFSHAHKYIVTKADHKITISETISKLQAAKIGRMENLFESDMVRFAILCVVIAQCLVISLQTNGDMVRNFRAKYGFDIFQLVQYVFMAIFATEIGAKLYIYKMKTFHSYEYGIYIVILLIELCAQATDYRNLLLTLENALRYIGVLRIFRITLPFKKRKFSSYFAGVRSVVLTILKSVEGKQSLTQDVVNISILVFGLTYLWANAGVVLFADSDPIDFGNLGSSFFSLFVAVTQIGWADSLAHLEIIVAVIVSNLEDLHKKAGETRKKRIQKLKSSKAVITGQNYRPIAPIPPANVSCWESQIPYEVPNFDLISKAKLENYFTVLAIMEENLAEYLKIVDSLKHIQGEIKELNSAMRAKMDEKHEIDFDDDVVNGNDVTGDALSRLLTKKRTEQKRKH